MSVNEMMQCHANEALMVPDHVFVPLSTENFLSKMPQPCS